MASGCTFTDLHYTFRVGISTATKIVKDVCSAIWSTLRAEFLPIPTKTQWKNIARGFETVAHFPHCLGAVDGKHIRLVCPKNSGSMYFNYKQYFSIVLMAVADSKYRFTYVNIGSYGKDCDASIFKETSLWKSIENNQSEIPEDEFIPGLDSIEIPYFFLGDEGFGLHRHLLRPYARTTHLTEQKKIFNYRLSRARRYVECAFGILSNKWRILHRPLNVEPDFAVKIVQACTVLHNFVLERDGFAADDMNSITELNDVSEEPGHRGRNQAANDVRNALSEYFTSECGSVSWQMSKI